MIYDFKFQIYDFKFQIYDLLLQLSCQTLQFAFEEPVLGDGGVDGEP